MELPIDAYDADGHYWATFPVNFKLTEAKSFRAGDYLKRCNDLFRCLQVRAANSPLFRSVAMETIFPTLVRQIQAN